MLETNTIYVILSLKLVQMGSNEILSVFGHLGSMELVVQPT